MPEPIPGQENLGSSAPAAAESQHGDGSFWLLIYPPKATQGWAVHPAQLLTARVLIKSLTPCLLPFPNVNPLKCWNGVTNPL